MKSLIFESIVSPSQLSRAEQIHKLKCFLGENLGRYGLEKFMYINLFSHTQAVFVGLRQVPKNLMHPNLYVSTSPLINDYV